MHIGIVQLRYLFYQIQSAGAATTCSAEAVGTEDPFAHSLLLALMLGFVEKAMGNELSCATTFFALQIVMVAVQLQSKAMEGFDIFKVDLHARYFTKNRLAAKRAKKQ